MKDNKFENLRQKAEEIVKHKGMAKSAEYINDIEKMIEELNIFQIELEMQNNELQFTNQKLNAEQEKYRDLYKNAPIAYFTLNKTGNIYDVNYAAAEMLNLPIQAFNKTSIFPYLEESSKQVFNQFFQKVFNSSKVEYSEINFIDTNNQIIHTKLNAQSYFDYNLKIKLCRCAVTDITRLKKYDKIIIEQNELLNLAFDNERVAWWDWDYESGEVRYSPNKATMLGYTVEEFPTQVYKITELIHPTDYEEVMQIMSNHLAGKTPYYEVTYRIRTKQGSYVYYYDFGKIIERTENGKPKRLNGIVFNINQQKQFEIALNEAKIKAENNENFNKMLFEILPIGLALAKSTGEFVYVNKAFTEIIGYTSEQTLQLSYWDITPQKYAQQEQEQLSSLETTGFYGTYEKEFIHQSGELIPVKLLGRYVEIDNKNYIWSSIENYTETKKYERTILANEKRFRAIFEQSAAGIAVVNKKQQIIEVNTKLCELLGYSKDELLNLSVKDITYSENAARNFENVRKKLSQNNTFFNLEKQYLCKDGSIIWANLSTNVVKDQNGVLDFAIATVVDITHRKKAEIELIDAKEKAEESNKLKSAFLNNMSHEVRTPLNAIVGFSQILTNQNISKEKQIQFCEVIQKSSDKLINIISDVIEISQIQAKLICPKIEKFDLVTLLYELKINFLHLAKEKNVELIFTPQKFTEFSIYNDREKVRKIMVHLIDNALKFTHKGAVTVCCDIEGENVQFSVSDQGIGISQEMHSKIFEPFRQVETGMIRNFGGNGLGLSLAKSYTELLNGSISLQSEINKGSTFFVTIPLLSNDFELTNIEKNPIKRIINSILIVEDEYANFQYLQELLSEKGYKILYAYNGKVAVDLCRYNTEIDLIFMDIKMPIMDGHTAAKLIKALRSDLPIIAQTAYVLESEQANYINDFDDYITKPIKEKELFKKLEKFKYQN